MRDGESRPVFIFLRRIEMPRKKEQTETMKKEVTNVTKVDAIVIVSNAPVIVKGKKYVKNDVIEGIDKAIAERLVNEGLAEWQGS